MRRHTESPLVECHKGHHVFLHRSGGHGVLEHAADHELCRRHEPLAHEVLQVLLHDRGRGPVLFRHGSRGKEKQRSLSPKKLPFLSHKHTLFRRKKEDEKAMADCARGHKGVQGRTFTFIAQLRRRSNRPLQGTIKDIGNSCLHDSPIPHTSRPLRQHRIRQPYPKWARRLAWACQKSGFQGKTHQLGQRRPEQIEQEIKRYKGWPTAGATRDPIEGTWHPQALYLSPGHEVSITPRPQSGLAPSCLSSL
jgi:hypothetical protein